MLIQCMHITINRTYHKAAQNCVASSVPEYMAKDFVRQLVDVVFGLTGF